MGGGGRSRLRQQKNSHGEGGKKLKKTLATGEDYSWGGAGGGTWGGVPPAAAYSGLKTDLKKEAGQGLGSASTRGGLVEATSVPPATGPKPVSGKKRPAASARPANGGRKPRYR